MFVVDVVLFIIIFLEDCFYLNVFKLIKYSDIFYFVVVWIYGGGFVNGGVLFVVYLGESFVK